MKVPHLYSVQNAYLLSIDIVWINFWNNPTAVPKEWLPEGPYIPIRTWFGLQSAAFWAQSGVKYKQLDHTIYPQPGCYFAVPSSAWVCEHFALFDDWLRGSDEKPGGLADVQTAGADMASSGCRSCDLIRYIHPCTLHFQKARYLCWCHRLWVRDSFKVPLETPNVCMPYGLTLTHTPKPNSAESAPTLKRTDYDGTQKRILQTCTNDEFSSVDNRDS